MTLICVLGWHKLYEFYSAIKINNGNSGRLYFGGAPKSLQMVTAAMGRKAMMHLDRILTNREITLPMSPSSLSYGFFQ